jgi:hypothetical protein
MTLNSVIGELILAMVFAVGVFVMTYFVDFFGWLIGIIYGAIVWLYIKTRYVWFK